MPGAPDAARMMSHTRSTPQLNWSSARYSPDRLEATACMVTVAPSATARTVTRARSPLATSSRISLSHKLTTTADSPAASVARTAETDRRRPARRAKSANAPTTRRASVTEALGLEQEQLGVAAVGGEQFGVASVLDNPAAVQDTDPIGVADCREAVGDEDRGQATGQVEEVLEERGLGADVEVCGRLVQHQDAGPGVDREQRAGQGDALPLPAGKVGAAGVLAVEGRGPPGREAVDHIQCPGAGGRAVKGGGVPQPVEAAEPDVVGGGKLVAHEVLEDHRQPPTPRNWIQLVETSAVDSDLAGLGVVQPSHQLHECGLARAVDADDGQRGSGRDGEV